MIVKPSARVRIQYKTSFFFFRYLLDALFDVYQVIYSIWMNIVS